MSPAVLLFLAFTGIPILATPFVADPRGDTVSWMVTVPISIVTATSFVALTRMLLAISSRTNDAGSSSQPPRPD